jgi:hypothetical protein
MNTPMTDERIAIAPAAPVGAAGGRFTRARLYLAAKVAGAAAFVVLGLSGGVAGAVSPDPTGGGAATLMGDITTWITDYGVPLIVGVMAVGLIVVLFIKYGKRAVKSGT